MKHKAVSYSSKCNPDHEDDDLDICHFFILSAGMLAVVSINDGNWKRVNPAFVRTLGWNESELLDTSYLAIVHPDDLKKTIKVIEDLKSGSNLVTCENRIRCKNGDYKWISWRASSEKNGLVYCAGTDITDYKKTQDELLHQNEILQHIFDNIPVMLAVNDGRFTKLKLNKFAEEILGWTSEEINKRDYMSTIYPDPDYRKNIYEFMQSGSKGWHEWEMTTKSGNKIPTTWANITLSDKTIIGIGVDLRDQKKAEEELRKSEERYRHVVETASEGICQIDNDYLIVMVNDRMAEMLGYSKEELIGQPYTNLVCPDQLPDFERHAALRRKGIDEPFERKLKCKDGSVIWALISATSLKNKAGGIIGSFGMFTDITQRKKFEDALKESEKRQKELIQYAPAGIYEIDFHTCKFISVNDALCNMSGYSKEELFKMDPFDLLDEEGKKLFRKRIDQWLSGTEPENYVTFHVRKKDGNIVYADLKVTFKKDPNGKPAGAFVIATDITERIRSENAVRESRAKLEAALASMSDAVLISDVNGNIIEFNEGFAKFYRFKNKEECARKFDDYPELMEVFFADGSPAPVNMWGVPRALRGETGINIEYTIRRRDTGETWVGSYSFAPIRDPKGKIAGSVVVSRDITDRKKVEEALEYNRNLLRSILDNSPNLIFVTCPDQKFMIVNNALAAKFGLKPEDLIGKSRFDILPEAIARQYSEHDKSILRSRKPMQFEESDTTAKIYLSFKFPLFDNNGKIYAIGGISTDISDLKKAQDILRRDKETFEHLVRERTQELLEAERELEQSKRLTDIGTLAATVAHELRNPLAAITVASTNAKRKLKDERIEKHLQTIERKVKESDQIINNLLFYSRIKPPQTSSVDIIKSIEECAELAAKHSKENIQIEKNIKALVGIKIDADPVQIREIFSNLLSNAFDSMEGRPGKITISATADQKNISITIKDQGVGIHKEDIPRVFETFFTTKSKGTGLGLSVCKQIISLHDGDIHIESELNKGTAVTVTFPRKKRAAMH